MSPTDNSEIKILVVDDEAAARSALSELLRDEGYVVHTAGDGFKALGQLEEWAPDIVVTDVQMPGMSGIELMEKIRERVPAVGVVVMTAFGSVENAVTAMQAGADDYLTKPVHFPELLVILDRLLESKALRQENERLRDALQGGDANEVGWVGSSKPARELMSLVKQVAGSDASVLVLGESGTGKELVARAVHHWSTRREGPFVVVPCAAMTEEMLETELFGDKRDRKGRFAEAAGGTLFLDDVAEIPVQAQVRLLGVMQEQQAGGGPDVRVIAATGVDLHREVLAGRFREDLFYRLNVITLRVPTLRERREDIPLLASHFLKRHAAKNHKYVRGFSDRALGASSCSRSVPATRRPGSLAPPWRRSSATRSSRRSSTWAAARDGRRRSWGSPRGRSSTGSTSIASGIPRACRWWHGATRRRSARALLGDFHRPQTRPRSLSSTLGFARRARGMPSISPCAWFDAGALNPRARRGRRRARSRSKMEHGCVRHLP